MLEKLKWGAGGIAKVSFKAKWGLDRAQILIHTHSFLLLLSSYMNETTNPSCGATKLFSTVFSNKKPT